MFALLLVEHIFLLVLNISYATSRQQQHFTPVLASVHCLPVHFRINVKIFPCKALILPYTLHAYTLPHYTPARSPWLADHSILVIPKSRLKPMGTELSLPWPPDSGTNFTPPLDWPQCFKTHLFSLVCSTLSIRVTFSVFFLFLFFLLCFTVLSFYYVFLSSTDYKLSP